MSTNLADSYRLRVSATPSYDRSQNVQIVKVNTDQITLIETEHAVIKVSVKIRDFRGLPLNSPESCRYFEYEEHQHDLFSISFSILFKQDTSFDDVLFGNDFDKPIRECLPYGFSVAYKIFNYAIDPSAEGDLYADKPYLYGYAVSSINILSTKSKTPFLVEDTESIKPESGGLDSKLPYTSALRRKFFLDEENRKMYMFKADREYYFDFFNPYLDMTNFVLKLPGYSLDVLRYWDGQPLRYVMKSKTSEIVYFTLLFELINDDTEITNIAGD
ncbi:hypothetical protein V1511DRAFT_512770 [Dipodascopsis uninucleata]